MCCFKPSPKWVAKTRIFATMTGKDRQAIAYTMSIGADEELAMILPIPVRLKSADDAVRFVNLEAYPTFFDDLAKGFPADASRSYSKSKSFGGGYGGRPMLEVVSVGKYEASFVPSIDDFDRLDERFRIERDIWLTRPEYAEYGFVVFKLKPGAAAEAQQDVEEANPPAPTGGVFGSRGSQGRKNSQSFHPMAFEFPVRRVGQPLFFPTLHIHDGELHAKETFDHKLYCQPPNPHRATMRSWTESQLPIEEFVDARLAAPLIHPGEHCFQRIVRGRRENADIWV